MFGSTDWSDLPADVWFSVGLKLDAASDRIRFRAVSKTFRSHLPYRQPPWLMLHQDSDSAEENECDSAPPRFGFVILGEQCFYRFHLPQVYQVHCIGSTNTWLIISKFDSVKLDKVVCLTNPFSRVEIHLPSETSLEHQILQMNFLLPPIDVFLQKAIIYEARPSSNCLVIALECNGILAKAKPGDSFWTILNVETQLHTRISDMVVFQQTLFAIDSHGQLWSCQIQNYPNSISPLLLTVVGQPFDKFQLYCFTGGSHPFQMLYLVECSGHLLLVIKFINMIGQVLVDGIILVPNYKTERFQVYEFDFTLGNWIDINSLGEYSLFLGLNTSVSVLATEFFGLVKKNCIYFTDDFHLVFHGSRTLGGYDMGVFDLDDNSINPHYTGTSHRLFSPQMWIVPV